MYICREKSFKPSSVYFLATIIILLFLPWSDNSDASPQFRNGSQIHRCRTASEVDTSGVFDPWIGCPLVEATTPPAASISDYIITTQVDF